MKITSRHVTNCYQSVVDNGRHHGLVLDLPEAKSGDDVGPTALELAAMALAGCVSTIWAVVAKNSKCSYRKMIVELDIEKPDSAPTFTEGKVVVSIDSDEEQEKLERILEKTMKACPVGRLFEQAGIELPTTVVKKDLLETKV
ncbi:MAG: OsmC family protein [Spirochaetota bacterium]